MKMWVERIHLFTDNSKITDNFLVRQVSGWSNLILWDTAASDSGVYRWGNRKIFQGSKIFTMTQHCRCDPSNARQDQVRVNIIKGEDTESADMMGWWSQDNGGDLMGKNNNVIIFIIFLLPAIWPVLFSLTLTGDGSENFYLIADADCVQ